MKELVDLRKQRGEHNPVLINAAAVGKVDGLIVIHITNNLTWSLHPDAEINKVHTVFIFFSI